MVKFKEILCKIEEELSQVKEAQKSILARLKERPISIPKNLEIDLPDHLRKSYLALRNLGGKGSASDVGALTLRSRAIESSYLNELVMTRHLNRERVHKTVLFKLKEEE